MKEVYKDIFHVGDSGCSVFLVNTHGDNGLVLIDCGMSLNLIKKISKVGLNPMEIKHCIITHFHIDHIAACSDLKDFNKKVKFYAHELDANAIEEKGHDRETAAGWYGVNYKPVKLEKRLKGDSEILKFGKYNFQCLHTPGHTPGSISILLETEDNKKKILFGQDLHGPIIPGVSNFEDYQNSLRKLLDLNADILCEGHFGIYQPASEVQRYIKQYIE
ncbi:MAG: MBL fold metallo-hydrolase [Candidatus Lokiarchaeota archaeon]|nr:MBL fold metallo-hydrolase [Candidatus Lokiarchaeota archaeon]